MRIAVAVTGLALAIGACGDGKDEPTAKKPAGVTEGAAIGPGTVQVRMRDGKFVPARATAKVGQIVVWVNQDDATHTVTARSAPRFSSPRLRPKASFTYRISAPGTITYVSRTSKAMRGTIVVSG